VGLGAKWAGPLIEACLGWAGQVPKACRIRVQGPLINTDLARAAAPNFSGDVFAARYHLLDE
jgi:hypothetical protein